MVFKSEMESTKRFLVKGKGELEVEEEEEEEEEEGEEREEEEVQQPQALASAVPLLALEANWRESGGCLTNGRMLWVAADSPGTSV